MRSILIQNNKDILVMVFNICIKFVVELMYLNYI